MEDNAGGGDNSGMKRPYPLDEQTGGDSDNDDDPKRLCIDEEGVNLQCPRCSYVAKWKSDLERHMKVCTAYDVIILVSDYTNLGNLSRSPISLFRHPILIGNIDMLLRYTLRRRGSGVAYASSLTSIKET